MFVPKRKTTVYKDIFIYFDHSQQSNFIHRNRFIRRLCLAKRGFVPTTFGRRPFPSRSQMDSGTRRRTETAENEAPTPRLRRASGIRRHVKTRAARPDGGRTRTPGEHQSDGGTNGGTPAGWSAALKERPLCKAKWFTSRRTLVKAADPQEVQRLRGGGAQQFKAVHKRFYVFSLKGKVAA